MGDDDDSDPTATAAIAAPTGENTVGTPVATPLATPRTQAGVGTPRAAVAATSTVPGTDSEDVDISPTADRSGGGTDETPTAAESDETPTSDDADSVEPTVVVVSSCDEPEELPERTGRQNRVVPEDGLRLRSGPGATCDEITLLAADTPVRVISGIVDAEDDENDWVKVDVDGEEGWVAGEFLVNPPAE